MTRTAALALCGALAACAQPVVPTPPPQPPLAQCDAACWQQCAADGIQYDPAPGTTDAIGNLIDQVVIPLRGRIEQCDAARLACQQCIDRLRRAGVVR